MEIGVPETNAARNAIQANVSRTITVIRILVSSTYAWVRVFGALVFEVAISGFDITVDMDLYDV